ncbi:MAG: glycosyltransferase family 87 protein [Acidobacteriia bacterium]|nr:glycosyltransferase family 87 protein [Terriglobia bacterium]
MALVEKGKQQAEQGCPWPVLSGVLRWPTVSWILMAFAIAYFCFFVRPVFLNSQHLMRFRSIPIAEVVGSDLNGIRSFSASWIRGNQTPYIGRLGANPYPPFTSVFFSPLVFMSRESAYYVITTLTLGCYIWATLLIPIWVSERHRDHGISMLLFTAGLFSYGFLFELERGQFNVIAFFLTLFSIYLFHRHRNFRYVAYALISVAIQLKLWPAIFVLMFVDNWALWRQSLRRVAGLMGLNVALLFCLGFQVFGDFVRSIEAHAIQPYVWVGNLSIQSFVGLHSSKWSLRLDFNVVPWGVAVLLVLFVVCLLLIAMKAYREKLSGLSPHLLLACSIGALIIPSESHDYKLSILTAPLIMVFSGFVPPPAWPRRTVSTLLVFVASLAYSSTLFSFANKHPWLQNNLPALMILLFCITGLALMTTEAPTETSS